MIKKVLLTVLAVLMVLGCASCKLMVTDEQKDLQQVVASVNGVEITKADVMAVYHTYRYYYGLTDENELTDQYSTTRSSRKGPSTPSLRQSSICSSRLVASCAAPHSL